MCSPLYELLLVYSSVYTPPCLLSPCLLPRVYSSVCALPVYTPPCVLSPCVLPRVYSSVCALPVCTPPCALPLCTLFRVCSFPCVLLGVYTPCVLFSAYAPPFVPLLCVLSPCVHFFVCALLRVYFSVCTSPCVLLRVYCQNSRTFDVVLPGVWPPFSGLPSDINEVLRCSSVESINRGPLSISCM